MNFYVDLSVDTQRGNTEIKIHNITRLPTQQNAIFAQNTQSRHICRLAFDQNFQYLNLIYRLSHNSVNKS